MGQTNEEECGSSRGRGKCVCGGGTSSHQSPRWGTKERGKAALQEEKDGVLSEAERSGMGKGRNAKRQARGMWGWEPPKMQWRCGAETAQTYNTTPTNGND